MLQFIKNYARIEAQIEDAAQEKRTQGEKMSFLSLIGRGCV